MNSQALKIAMVVAGAGALLWLSLHPREQEKIAVGGTLGSAPGASVTTSASTGVASSVLGSARKAAPSSAVKTSLGADVVSTSVKLSPETQERLATFAKVGKKVFTSEREKEQRALTLHDESFLRQVAGVLASRSLDASTLAEQNQAVDALLAAQAAGVSVASELLRGIVNDAQVEDAKLPQDVRENLAGVKAEVMYKWTAAEPTAAIASALPGPVSQRIWANVQDRQSRNVAESVTLKR